MLIALLCLFIKDFFKLFHEALFYQLTQIGVVPFAVRVSLGETSVVDVFWSHPSSRGSLCHKVARVTPVSSCEAALEPMLIEGDTKPDCTDHQHSSRQCCPSTQLILTRSNIFKSWPRGTLVRSESLQNVHFLCQFIANVVRSQNGHNSKHWLLAIQMWRVLIKAQGNCNIVCDNAVWQLCNSDIMTLWVVTLLLNLQRTFDSSVVHNVMAQDYLQKWYFSLWPFLRLPLSRKVLQIVWKPVGWPWPWSMTQPTTEVGRWSRVV